MKLAESLKLGARNSSTLPLERLARISRAIAIASLIAPASACTSRDAESLRLASEKAKVEATLAEERARTEREKAEAAREEAATRERAAKALEDQHRLRTAEPSVKRMKQDLLGRKIQVGGVFFGHVEYGFENVEEFLNFQILAQKKSDAKLEIVVDTVLRRSRGTNLRCFAKIGLIYSRADANDAWRFVNVSAQTLTCEK